MIRPSIAAPKFYPATGLSKLLDIYSATYRETVKKKVEKLESSVDKIKGLILPYGPYTYSAGISIVTWGILKDLIKQKNPTFLFIAVSETFTNKNIGIYSYKGWQTPLGIVSVDTNLVYELSKEASCSILERTSERETAVELQLPFIQYLFRSQKFKILPVAVSEEQSVENVFNLISLSVGLGCIPIVCSTVSNSSSSSKGAQLDAIANKFIPALDQITVRNKCQLSCKVGVLAMMEYAKVAKLNLRLIDYVSSSDFGDTRALKDGYSSFFLY